MFLFRILTGSRSSLQWRTSNLWKFYRKIVWSRRNHYYVGNKFFKSCSLLRFPAKHFSVVCEVKWKLLRKNAWRKSLPIKMLNIISDFIQCSTRLKMRFHLVKCSTTRYAIRGKGALPSIHCLHSKEPFILRR